MPLLLLEAGGGLVLEAGGRLLLAEAGASGSPVRVFAAAGRAAARFAVEAVMPAGVSYELRPVFPIEDVRIVVTVPGTNVTGWVVLFHVSGDAGVWFSEDGDTGLACAVTNGAAGEITATLATNYVGTVGQLPPGTYRWGVWRDDAGARTVLAWGTLVVLAGPT